MLLLLFFSHNFFYAATNFDRWKLISAMEWMVFHFLWLSNNRRTHSNSKCLLCCCWCCWCFFFVLFFFFIYCKWILTWIATEKICFFGMRKFCFWQWYGQIRATAWRSKRTILLWNWRTNDILHAPQESFNDKNVEMNVQMCAFRRCARSHLARGRQSMRKTQYRHPETLQHWTANF